MPKRKAICINSAENRWTDTIFVCNISSLRFLKTTMAKSNYCVDWASLKTLNSREGISWGRGTKGTPRTQLISSTFQLGLPRSFSECFSFSRDEACVTNRSDPYRHPFFTHFRTAFKSRPFSGRLTMALQVRGLGIGHWETMESSTTLIARHKLPYFQSSAFSTRLARSAFRST